MKKILVVINTLGHAGAEVALMELLRRLTELKNPESKRRLYELDLFVLTGQGEMVSELPEGVRLLNKDYNDSPVLSSKGRSYLRKTVLRSCLKRGSAIKLIPYMFGNGISMLRRGRILPDKLLWRLLSDSADRFDTIYDLAVSYLEGGSAYYVADHVNAKKKAAFIHVDYGRAGYTRKLDNDCYLKFDKVFTVSDEVRATFVEAYPECENRTEVFHNMLNREKIIEKSKMPGGFDDNFDGYRILTVGRLERQKAFEVSVDAMALLKKRGINARWYVLGEGSERKKLEEKIEACGLKNDFLLVGAVDNPYPCMAQADIYVHASRFEGKSIAIQEAQILAKPILVSDCSGNREQVKNGTDGLMCSLEAEAIADNIVRILKDEALRTRLGKAAELVNAGQASEIEKIQSLLGDFKIWGYVDTGTMDKAEKNF